MNNNITKSKTWKISDIIRIDGVAHMIIQTGYRFRTDCVIVNLSNGRSWNEPLKVNDLQNITEAELKELLAYEVNRDFVKFENSAGLPLFLSDCNLTYIVTPIKTTNSDSNKMPGYGKAIFNIETPVNKGDLIKFSHDDKKWIIGRFYGVVFDDNKEYYVRKTKKTKLKLYSYCKVIEESEVNLTETFEKDKLVEVSDDNIKWIFAKFIYGGQLSYYKYYREDVPYPYIYYCEKMSGERVTFGYCRPIKLNDNA